MSAAAQEFLGDAAAVEAYLEVDRRREEHLRELHDAFISFRDADESIHRLVKRIKTSLWEEYTPRGGGHSQNLWGFQNEDERHFPERFGASAPRLPDTDLASLFRSYLEDESRKTDEQKIQLLLAFGEFVASLDARAKDGDPRLGVGPAANFLTFAWHCMSMGAEPVFLYTTNRAVKAFDEAAGAKDTSGAPNLERRFQTFFALARRLGRSLEGAPQPMRRGWGVEHALEWILDRYEGTSQLKALLEDSTSASVARRARLENLEGGRPVIVPASGSHARPAAATRTAELEPVRADVSARREEPALPAFAAAAPGTDPRRPRTEPGAADEDTRARQRARIGELSKKQKVVVAEAPPMIDKTGAEFADAVPPDRTPPLGMPRPSEEARVEAPKPEAQRPDPPRRTETRAEARTETRAELRGESPRTEPRRPEAPRSEAPRTEPKRPEPPPEAPKPEPKKLDAKAEQRVVESWWSVAVEPTPAEKKPTPPPEAPPIGNDRTEELDGALDRPGAKSVARGKPAPARRGADDDDSTDLALDALVGELRGEVVEVSRGEPARGAPPPDRLARDLFLDPAVTAEISSAVEQRGRVLLTGPPWVGKTHVGRRLAIHLAGHVDRVLVIRLHPSLTYADLMGREPGLVRSFCERARDDNTHRYALVLDELDRSDGGRALGELPGALAERGQAVSLGSTGASFTAPRNLLVVATARELPRDASLTARFPVHQLTPDPEVLRRYLAQCRPALEWVSVVLRNVNARLTAERRAVQVGHGVFMDPDLDADRVRLIWRREVLPLLMAHGIGPDAFDLDRLRRES